jgi:hypothetical protein
VYKGLAESISVADGVLSCDSTHLESKPSLTALIALFQTSNVFFSVAYLSLNNTYTSYALQPLKGSRPRGGSTMDDVGLIGFGSFRVGPSV